METTLDELKQRAGRCKAVIDGLKDYEPFKQFVEDMNHSIRVADDSWHLLREDERDKMADLKVLKLAAQAVVTSLDKYQQDYDELMEKIDQEQNPDKYQTGYYDDE